MIVVDVRWASPLKPLLYRMASFTRTPSAHGFAHCGPFTVNRPQQLIHSERDRGPGGSPVNKPSTVHSGEC